MPHRVVQELQSAWLTDECPSVAKGKQRLRGLKAKGKSFEKKVGRELKRLISPLEPPPELRSEQWIAYQDRNGPGWGQPDHYLVFPDRVLLIECKLTQRAQAIMQMRELYVPLLLHIYARPVTLIQACRNLSEAWKWRCKSPLELLEVDSDRAYLWHVWR